jgi:hypothetical protein
MAYRPGIAPDKEHILKYLEDELNRIGAEFDTKNMIPFLSVAPTKPREGLLVGADGTNWNPGSGKGIYAYYTGAWHLLG